MSNHYESPSNYWSREHRGGTRRQRPTPDMFKRAHRYRWLAAWHAFRLNLQRGERREPYSCHWTDNYRDGETGALHWHVGRKPSAPRSIQWAYPLPRARHFKKAKVAA